MSNEKCFEKNTFAIEENSSFSPQPNVTRDWKIIFVMDSPG